MKARFLSLALAGLMWAGLVLAQININTATPEELDSLKGIGPTKAKAIVDYRKKNGPFRTVDDLGKVPGIGPATLQDIRRDVVVSGASRTAIPVARPADEAPKPARPQANPAAAPARPATPAMPGKATEVKAAPRSEAPAKPVADVRPMPAPARPAAPAVPAKAVAEGKPAAPAAPAAPAKPAGPAMPSAAKPATPAAPPAPSAMPGAPAKPPAPARPAMAN